MHDDARTHAGSQKCAILEIEQNFDFESDVVRKRANMRANGERSHKGGMEKERTRG